MVGHPSTAISSSSVGATAPPPESLLIDHIRAHVKQGEKAKERADQAREKAEQHFIAAGKYLFDLKTHYAPTWQRWEIILETKVKLSTGRASELMQLADGRKDLQQIRDGKAQSVARLRAHSSSLQASVVKRPRSEEGYGESPVGSDFPVGQAAPIITKRDAALQLIKFLMDKGVREMATKMVIEGERQNDFDDFRDAALKLYAVMMGVGR
jgi:hypothetical protein